MTCPQQTTHVEALESDAEPHPPPPTTNPLSPPLMPSLVFQFSKHSHTSPASAQCRETCGVTPWFKNTSRSERSWASCQVLPPDVTPWFKDVVGPPFGLQLGPKRRVRQTKRSPF